jgi:hypothetical protein
VYKDTLQKHNIPPTRIYNADGPNLSTIQKTGKIFARSGIKQAVLLTSADRWIHVNVVCCVNPYGHYIHSALIFSHKNGKNELIDKAPLGTLRIAHETV